LCLEKYLEFSESIFGLEKNILKVPVGENNAYFNEKPLEEALKKVIHEATKSDDTPLADDTIPSCPVFVAAAHGRIGDGTLRLFRSYGFYKDQTPIWQAARATSAGPTFFPPAWVTVPPPPGWYVDGGVRANNPSWEALVEGKKYWKTRKCFIVSIGTGSQKPADFIRKKNAPNTLKKPVEIKPPEAESSQTGVGDNVQPTDSEQPSKSIFGGLKRSFQKATVQPVTDKITKLARIPGGLINVAQIVEALVKLSTSSESTHLRVWEEAHSQDESAQFPYFRFNVDRGMEEIGLEEWKMNEKMTALTRSYLDSPVVKQELEKCAQGLLYPAVFEST
jgi:predicted acylesterase/phospholipase RssA